MEKIKREKLFTKIVCTSLAIILWFYVSYFENPTMTKTVRNVTVGIKEEHTETLRGKGLWVKSIEDDSIDVKVTARRLSLAKLTNKTLSSYLNVSSITKSGTYILPAIVVSDETSDATYYVKDRNITIVIEPILTGTFDIEADVVSNYVAYDSVSLDTQRVTVSAPESVLSEIDVIKTEEVTIDSLIKDKMASLVAYDKEGNAISEDKIKFTPSEVKVEFSYLKEKTVPTVIKKADGKTVKLSSQYDVTIYGSSEDISSITAVETESINFNSYKKDDLVKIKRIIPKEIKISDDDLEAEIKIIQSYLD